MNVKKIKPMFNMILTTMNKYEDDYKENGIINPTKSKGTLKEYQKVIAVGSSVRDIKVGDIVCINPKRYATMKHKDGSLKDGVIKDNPVVAYNFDVILLDGVEYLKLYDNDVDFIVTEYEDDPKIIKQREKKLIV